MLSISVCMTTYNGSLYVEQQISSILSQLRAFDELIICDDCSTDSTVNIIKSFNDVRIQVVVNDCNLGFNRNFTKCISLAKNDLIFISDQDDIWLANKVETYLRVFDQNSDVLAVMSNMEIINSDGQVISNRFLNLESGCGNKFLRLARYYIKSTYYGCSMAFRSKLKSRVLPLPFHFDTWIGLVSDIYGHCYHVDAVTMQYRRHGRNFSALKTFPFYTVIKWRLKLLLNIVALMTGVRTKLLQFSALKLLDG